jgi:Protein of unknown function (DUF3499)
VTAAVDSGFVAKLCGRPGCSEPGAVAYGMVPEDLLFWIEALDRAAAADAAVLCRRHADAMVVPRGWTLDDRREAVPRLFRSKVDREDTASQPRPRRRGQRAVPAVVATASAVQLDLEVAGEEREPAPELPPEPWQAEPWRPAFDVDDDLDGLLEVRSPLLARAFRGTGRRRG